MYRSLLRFLQQFWWHVCRTKGSFDRKAGNYGTWSRRQKYHHNASDLSDSWVFCRSGRKKQCGKCGIFHVDTDSGKIFSCGIICGSLFCVCGHGNVRWNNYTLITYRSRQQFPKHPDLILHFVWHRLWEDQCLEIIFHLSRIRRLRHATDRDVR